MLKRTELIIKTICLKDYQELKVYYKEFELYILKTILIIKIRGKHMWKSVKKFSVVIFIWQNSNFQISHSKNTIANSFIFCQTLHIKPEFLTKCYRSKIQSVLNVNSGVYNLFLFS